MKIGNSNLTTISIVVGFIFSLTAPTKPQTSADDFPVPVGSRRNDFSVKFKGRTFRWKKLVRQHNIHLPDENAMLAAVLEQNKYHVHSCNGRCFLDERKYDKTCFCDKVCRTFSDCCLDFFSRCNQTGNNVSVQNVACGDVNERSWFGIIMKSSCSAHGHQRSTNDCETAQRLDMTLQKELPVFDLAHKITYRSIACARCNNEGNFSFWGLDISCERSNGSIATPVNITAVKRFLKEHPDCSWKYAPMQKRKQQYKSCVLHDTQCASDHLPVISRSVVKELCYSYSMVFSVSVERLGMRFTYRNPHCALCNPESEPERITPTYPPATGGPVFAPLSILLDVGSNIKHSDERNILQPGFISVPETQNLTSQLFNCTSTFNNCTVKFEGQICEVLPSSKKQSTQMLSSLNKSAEIPIRSKEIASENNSMDLTGNTAYIWCPEHQAVPTNKDPKHGSATLVYITFLGTSLSIISLCFLLSVYLSFKELRNLPGKCLINLSLALLFYQSVFLGSAKSTEIRVLCKAVAIFLHFFIVAAFSWMSVMAFDTGNTFTVKVRNTRRQPSDIRKTFIKYCIVGWGLPAVVVVLCFVLDFTGTFYFGYGNSTYCWISDKTAIAVAMVTPVSFALIFNTVCLVKNARVIRRLQQGARLAASNRSRTSVTLICIKLTTVMGLTWILGLLANWNQTAFLQYPSTILNSMQGFFIALCFTTTKKVRSLLKERFCNRENGAAEPQANVPRDQCAGNIGAEKVPGSNTFEMKCLIKGTSE